MLQTYFVRRRIFHCSDAMTEHTEDVSKIPLALCTRVEQCLFPLKLAACAGIILTNLDDLPAYLLT